MSSGAAQLRRGLYVHSESSRRVFGELLQKALPLAPWSDFFFFSSKATSVCRQMQDGGLMRGAKRF